LAIISVSRREDIPAFKGQWFVNLLNKGSVEITKPFTFKKEIISLKKADIDAFVFWSKNYIPFTENLLSLSNSGYKFYLNYTVNNYPFNFEGLKNSSDEIIKNLVYLSTNSYLIFWRYDPVYISKATDFDFHIKNFTRLCEIFSNKVNRVIINFIQEYPKVLRRLGKYASNNNFSYIKIKDEEKIELALELRKIADKFEIPVHSCTKILYESSIVKKSHCIDKFIIDSLINANLNIAESPTFSGCHCYKSIDIGSYNQCDNQCLYCYAKN